MSDPLEPLDYVSDDGNLVINSIAMRCPAWAVLDLTTLWLPASVRGQNRIVPGAAGVIANPKRKTITRHELVLVITGAVDENGTAFPERWDGLYTNLATLGAGVFAPPNPTYTATLTLPDAGTKSAEVQCYDLQPVRKVNAIHVYTFQMEIPLGEFA